MDRVLLVEGRADLAELLQEMLPELDLEVVVATTVSAALTEATGAGLCFALLEVNVGQLKSYPIAGSSRSTAGNCGRWSIS